MATPPRSGAPTCAASSPLTSSPPVTLRHDPHSVRCRSPRAARSRLTATAIFHARRVAASISPARRHLDPASHSRRSNRAGRCSNRAATGRRSKCAAMGHRSKRGATGRRSKRAATGRRSKRGATGRRSKRGAMGRRSAGRRSKRAATDRRSKRAATPRDPLGAASGKSAARCQRSSFGRVSPQTLLLASRWGRIPASPPSRAVLIEISSRSHAEQARLGSAPQHRRR